MLYHFRKWFFDFNIGEETYVYFFIAEIRFLFFTARNFTFHCFDKRLGTITRSGPVSLIMKRGDWESMNIKGKKIGAYHTKKELSFISEFNDISVRLLISNYLSDIPDNPLLIVQKNKQIGWFPLMGSMLASGSVKAGGKGLNVVNAPCYVDHVSSTILPFNIPVKKMYWARIIGQDVRISYSVTITDKEEQIGRCFVTFNEKHYCYPRILWERSDQHSGKAGIDPYEGSYIITADNGSEHITIIIEHIKTAAEGAFIDPEKYKNKFLYRLLSRISKNPRGKKYFSHAEVNLDLDNKNYKWDKLICIDEYVLF